MNPLPISKTSMVKVLNAVDEMASFYAAKGPGNIHERVSSEVNKAVEFGLNGGGYAKGIEKLKNISGIGPFFLAYFSETGLEAYPQFAKEWERVTGKKLPDPDAISKANGGGSLENTLDTRPGEVRFFDELNKSEGYWMNKPQYVRF